MTSFNELSDLQLILLSTASQRDDSSLLPLPDHLKHETGRVEAAIQMLISRGLMEECIITNRAAAWREEGDAPIGLIITPAGHQALSLDESSTDSAASLRCARPAPRSGSKQALVIDLIGRDNGATIDELILATGWLPHTTRAVISGLRKRGIPVISARDGGVSRYRVLGAAK